MGLKAKHLKTIELLRRGLSEYDFYLAGGTGLFYYFEHRESVDLDFFTETDFSVDVMSKHIADAGGREIGRDKGTIHAIVRGTKLSAFHYPYPLIAPATSAGTFTVASVEDIAAMKMIAISTRGSRKDFIDIYFIMTIRNWNAQKLVELTLNKFPQTTDIVILKGILFFKDAEGDRSPLIHKGSKSWREMREFIKLNFSRLL